MGNCLKEGQQRVKVMIFVVVVFVGGAGVVFHGLYTEFKHHRLIRSGIRATAKVTNNWDVKEDRTRLMGYKWSSEDGKERRGLCVVPVELVALDVKTVEILYLPEADANLTLSTVRGVKSRGLGIALKGLVAVGGAVLAFVLLGTDWMAWW